MFLVEKEGTASSFVGMWEMQDRLPKELGYGHITTLEAANRFIREECHKQRIVTRMDGWRSFMG
jgi:hypothetical protein